jgi:hypothetical protein
MTNRAAGGLSITPDGSFPDDRSCQYFYWDDIPVRRLDPATLNRETALEQAKAAARAGEAA